MNQPHFITLAQEAATWLDKVGTLTEIPANAMPEELPAIEDEIS